jgi:hypothetical protein
MGAEKIRSSSCGGMALIYSKIKKEPQLSSFDMKKEEY